MRHLVPTALALVTLLPAAHAGDVDAHVRALHFSWTEDIAGHDPIRERGMMVAVGLSRSLAVGELLRLAGSVELWGGRIDYDGYAAEGWTPYKADTRYVGTREELGLGLALPLSPSLTLQPSAGIGHRYWRRSRSNETWNTIFGRLGGRLEHRAGGGVLFAEAGAVAPMSTRVQVDWTDSGYGRFVLAPRNAASPFATVGWQADRLSVSLSYETMEFGKSQPVAVSRTSGVSGAVIDNSQAYQPDSKSSMFGLSIQYRF
jgi:hypothetical protein